MPLVPVARLLVSSLAVTALLAAPRAAWATASPASDAVAPAPVTDTPTPEDPSCAVERRTGVTEEEADAIEDVMCDLVRATPSAPGRYRIRVTRIGSKLLLRLRVERGGRSDEKQITISSIDEVSVAAPRLIEATAEDKPVEETLTVDNVVGGETRRPKKRPAAVHGHFGVIGATALGHGLGGGLSMGLGAGTEAWQFVGDLRVAGEAFNKPAALALEIFTLGAVEPDTTSNAFSFVSLSGGVRHAITNTDVSPFVGGGLALAYLAPDAKGASEQRHSSGSLVTYTGGDSRYGSFGSTGLAGYLEIGLDVLRTQTIGGSFNVRADAPTFTIEKVEPSGDPGSAVRTVAYAPVVSAGFALRF